MFCSSPKQHESSWRQLSVRKEASHIHSAVVPSANSAAKQKNKQQLEGLRRLKVLARAPLARLWRDLGSICQSSSTRRSQTYIHLTVFEKSEWKHWACVNLRVFRGPPVWISSLCFSMLLICSAFISTPTQCVFSQPHDWHSLSLPPLFPGSLGLELDHTSRNFTTNLHSTSNSDTGTSFPPSSQRITHYTLLKKGFSLQWTYWTVIIERPIFFFEQITF